MLSLRQKLLLLILPLCLVPLIAISVFSYFQARDRITEDRLVLFLEQIARDISDTIHLTLLEKTEEVVSMSLYGELREYVRDPRKPPPQDLLDVLIEIHEVYDFLVLFDQDGRIVLTNSHDRNRIAVHLNEAKLKKLRGRSILDLTPDAGWLKQVMSGRFAYVNWHQSALVHDFYQYEQEDVARQYGLGFAAPILDPEGQVVGGILAVMSWEYVQEILDKVEEDLDQKALRSGYAFLVADGNTIIGHKFRQNRSDVTVPAGQSVQNYGRRLRDDLHLDRLYELVSEGRRNGVYESPPGVRRIVGLAHINHEFFQWVCIVGIDEKDIFAPVFRLKNVLITAVSVTVLMVLFLTWWLARTITVPIKRLKQSAGVIAGGDFSQRVDVTGQDEIGELARTFNEMASSLEERSAALLELNRNLEAKVRARTRELEKSNVELQKAYQELKETQVQLVQSEKMASLGQLVSGIAHEIKNPLNFIYGNTGFLKHYVESLKGLIALYESRARFEPKDAEEIEGTKRSLNYDFMLEDLDTLIRNFEEGAGRINAIIGDLKTFSRIDREDFRAVDIHEPVTLALNLLHNEYRDRIRIHKEFGIVPPVECHPGKISQVFLNLLANACHAIVAQGDVWIRTSCRDGKVVLEVEDNGVGIEKQNLGKIFEPFFTTKPAGQGTGLGLSITYGIVQQHRGTIEVESQKGEGTLFRVQLPLKHEQA